MNYFKLATITFAALTLSITAQAGSIKSAKTTSQSQTNSTLHVKKTRTVRIVKKAIRLPAPRRIATHTTRSVLFYNPSETRTKIIHTNVSGIKTPNLFRN